MIMIYTVLFLWLLTALIIIKETKMVRMVLWLVLSSLIGALAFFMLGSPDVAMAEAVISSYTTVFFIVCFEKYYGLRRMSELLKSEQSEEESTRFRNHIFPIIFTLALLVLFIYFIPDNYFNTYLRDQYLRRFHIDVGGQNAVTAIYLAYRVYDTLFEALMLVIAVVAVIHLSQYDDTQIIDGKRSGTEKSGMALLLIRVAAPITILFGIYLIVNGFITAGGGFQGGLAVAAFFICRYLIYDIYDMPIKKINNLEKIVFSSLTLLAALVIFQEMLIMVPYNFRPAIQISYLVLMNGLLGIKVACGFLILFYRYIAIERN